ncbi:MAG: enoyl-CoA hydratase-related protein [Ilumatobacteraceae bacterium]
MSPIKPYPPVVDGLVVTVADGVVTVLFDRAERRNALTDDMVLALTDVVDAATADDSTRVLHLTAAGRDFCTGFDLSLRGGGPPPRTGAIQRRMRWHVGRLMPALVDAQIPIVCSVQGAASGLGMAIALAADFTIAAEDAKFISPFTGMGFTPDSALSWLLPRLIGVARAKDVLMLGRRVSGADAAAWGMIHAAVPAEDLAGASADLVARVGTTASVAVGLAKALIHRGLSVDMTRHLADEALAMELSSRSDDFREAGQAARDNRRPDFTGR